MTFIQMSVSGGVMIGVIAGIRALLINRLPKKTFLALWAVVLLRLLVPFSISSPFSVYRLVQPFSAGLTEGQRMAGAGTETEAAKTELETAKTGLGAAKTGLGAAKAGLSKDYETGVGGGRSGELAEADPQTMAGSQGKPDRSRGLSAWAAGLSRVFGQISLWVLLWAAGAGIFATYFAISYIRCFREFQMHLPVEEKGAKEWLESHRLDGGLGRTIALGQLQGISAPLTYGIFRPVILVPKEMDWGDSRSTTYVLEHECIHIQRLDALTKILLTGALCLHWFNPLVWLFYLLANRDLELSCDEAVIRRFGTEAKASYARTLIGMEETRSRWLSLYNGFSKNAIEERITAIMKLHKPSLGVFGMALALVIGISAVFATSAHPDSLREALTSLPGEEFTQEESQMLFALWVQGYENMTVSAYQEQMWQMVDTLEYQELIERFSQWECVYELPNGREAEAFSAFTRYYFSVFELLTGDRWREREVSDFVQSYAPGTREPAILEYVLKLKVLDGDKLLVGTYEAVAPAVREGLKAFLEERTREEMQDEVGMLEAIKEESRRLEQELGTENLSLTLEYSYIPVGEPDDDFLSGQVSARAQEEERAIEEREARQTSPGKPEDYASLLSLKTADYQERTLAEFNQALLDWCNQNPEGMESIGEDMFRGDMFQEEYPVSLTSEDKAFLSLTFCLSREENYRRINRENTGKPLEAAWVGGRKYYRQEERTGAWCTLYDQISYVVKDPEKITVGERDACVGGMLEGIEKFWKEASLESLLSMSEEQVVEYFQDLARQYSTDQLTISIDENQIQFEHQRGSRVVSWDQVKIMQYEEDESFYIHNVFANFSGKTITEMEYAMLAFDAAGKPLKLQWNYLDSSSESAYEHVVRQADLEIETAVIREKPGGWSLLEPVEYALFEVKQITFSDGTVWENPGYEDWLACYRGVDTAVTELKNYYPRETEILLEH